MKDDEKKTKMVKRYQVNLAGIVKEEGTHEDRVSNLQLEHRRNGKRLLVCIILGNNQRPSISTRVKD